MCKVEDAVLTLMRAASEGDVQEICTMLGKEGMSVDAADEVSCASC